MTCGKAGASPACPGVMRKASGLQALSASRDLGGRSAAGASEGMIVWLAGRGPF